MLIHRRGKRGGACDIVLPFWDNLAASHELHSMRRYGMPRRKGKICPRKDSNTRVHRSRARNTPSGHRPVNGPTIEGGFAITGAKHRRARAHAVSPLSHRAEGPDPGEHLGRQTLSEWLPRRANRRGSPRRRVRRYLQVGKGWLQSSMRELPGSVSFPDQGGDCPTVHIRRLVELYIQTGGHCCMAIILP